MVSFSCKTKMIFGGCETLKNFDFQRLLVVTDPFFAKNGMAERLGHMARNYEIFAEVVPDPSVELVAKGTARVKEFLPDGVVALGGGSAMDCAKAMVFFSGVKTTFVAIPTTSGSGSEVTDFAILTHGNVKHPLVDEALQPDIAILDESLLVNLPQSLIADSGFDAVSHAVEAFVGINHTPMSDAISASALRILLSDLPKSYHGDTRVRLDVHAASTMAAMAFSQAGLGACHALAHSLGGAFHVPHGRLNAVLLPQIVEENGNSRYAELAKMAGLGGESDFLAVKNLKKAILHLRRELSLPETLSAAGIAPSGLHSRLEEIVSAAKKDACSETNPVPVTGAYLRRALSEVQGK